MTRLEAPRRLKDLAFPARGRLSRLRFQEGDWLTALVPDDEVFGLVREVILQRLYEIGGGVPAGTVVDAGAHVGLFSLIAAQHARRVVALEPDPVNFRVLETNCRSNGAGNVEPVNAALWAEAGQISFDPSWHTTGGRVRHQGKLKVDTVTLDGLIEKYGPIDLLKMDIEGAEMRVIPQAARLGEVNRIVGELHLNRAGDEGPVVDALREHGFEVRLVPAPALYRPRWVPQVIRNWRRLQGQRKVKLGVLAYLLLPVKKPRRPPGSRDMPILLARSLRGAQRARR